MFEKIVDGLISSECLKKKTNYWQGNLVIFQIISVYQKWQKEKNWFRVDIWLINYKITAKILEIIIYFLLIIKLLVYELVLSDVNFSATVFKKWVKDAIR